MEEEDPVIPSPESPLVDVDGIRDWHADTSPFAQSCVVESCWELPGVKFGLLVDCALAAVRVKATEKRINIRKHLLMHDLILLSFGRKVQDRARLAVQEASLKGRSCLPLNKPRAS